MGKIRIALPRVRKIMVGALLGVGLIVLVAASPQERSKPEIIQGVITGTGLQAGQLTNFTLAIYEFSTPDDKQVLVDAFQKSQNVGLFNALSKMRAVGRVAITGTLGYDVKYIRWFPTPAGRSIRFITDRKISMAEAWSDSRSEAYDLSGGIIEMNDKEMKKSSGVVYGAAKLVMKDGEPTIDVANDPWKVASIRDNKGTPEN
ncbi:MAG: hypothetical protein WB723_19535 [Candidatus Acidiferrales bacterium]